MILPTPRLLLPALLLLVPVLGRAQPHRVDTAGFALRPLAELNTPADDYAAAISPNGQWMTLTSSRAGHSALYRSQATGKGWGVPQPIVDSVMLDPRTDNGALALALPPQVMLGLLSTRELERALGGEAMLGVLVTGKHPDGATDADLAAVHVRLSDGALVPDPQLIENIRLVKSGLTARSESDSDETEQLNSTSWDSQAALAPDGSFVIFSSDRPGGVGGADLWISDRLPSGRYGAVRNLGAAVNSNASDFSPFIAQDGRTLFFASTRAGGMGGSDIYRVQQRSGGDWGEPENLGAAINTAANESFFFALGRERCVVASDRPGGRGGFDLYEGRPNIFATGYTRVRLRMVDTTAGRDLAGTASVAEMSLGHSLGTVTVDPAKGGSVLLPGGFAYRFDLRTASDSVRSVTTRVLPSDTSLTIEVRFGSPPPPPEVTLSIEGVNLPLYVSGYYRLNTLRSLDSLRARQGSGGDLRSATYIAELRDDSAYAFYQQRAVEVESQVDRFVQRGLTEIFPVYRTVRKPGEYLEISVVGYADPRPIVGSYREEPKVFYDSLGGKVAVKRGMRLSNYLLAGLRAAYAVEELDERFRGASDPGGEAYRELVAEGAIRWRPLSGDVDEASSGDDLSQRRRIVVVLRRVEP